MRESNRSIRLSGEEQKLFRISGSSIFVIVGRVKISKYSGFQVSSLCHQLLRVNLSLACKVYLASKINTIVAVKEKGSFDSFSLYSCEHKSGDKKVCGQGYVSCMKLVFIIGHNFSDKYLCIAIHDIAQSDISQSREVLSYVVRICIGRSSHDFSPRLFDSNSPWGKFAMPFDS